MPIHILTALVFLLTVIGDANAQSEPPKTGSNDVSNYATDLPDHAIKILGNLDYKCSGRIAFLDEVRIVSFENNGASIIGIKSGEAQKVLDIGQRNLWLLESFRNRWMVGTSKKGTRYQFELFDVENPGKVISNEFDGRVLDVFEDGSKMLVKKTGAVERGLELVRTSDGKVLSTWKLPDGIRQIETAQLTDNDSAVAISCWLSKNFGDVKSTNQFVFLALDKTKGEFGDVISKFDRPENDGFYIKLNSLNKGPFAFFVRGNGGLTAFNFLTGERRQFNFESRHISSIDIDKHTGRILTSAVSGIDIWNSVTRKSLVSLTGRCRVGGTACFSPSGNTFATNTGSRLRIWDSQSGELLYGPSVEELAALSSVAITANDDAVAVADATGRVEVWDVKKETRRKMAYNPIRNGQSHDCWISPHFLSFSKDQRFLLGGSDRAANLVNVWDSKSGVSASRISGHQQPIMAVAWSPDNRMIASTDRAGVVQLTSNSGKVVGEVQGWMVSAFLPDGKHIATAQVNDSCKLDIFNLATGNLVATLVPPEDVAPLPYGLAVAPKGNLIAAAYQDGELVVWNYKTGEVAYSKKMEAEHYKDGMSAVSFSSDGKTLAFSSGGYEIWLLDAATGKEKLRLKESDNVRGLVFGKSLLATITPHHVTLWKPEL